MRLISFPVSLCLATLQEMAEQFQSIDELKYQQLGQDLAKVRLVQAYDKGQERVIIKVMVRVQVRVEPGSGLEFKSNLGNVG